MATAAPTPSRSRVPASLFAWPGLSTATGRVMTYPSELRKAAATKQEMTFFMPVLLTSRILSILSATSSGGQGVSRRLSLTFRPESYMVLSLASRRCFGVPEEAAYGGRLQLCGRAGNVATAQGQGGLYVHDQGHSQVVQRVQGFRFPVPRGRTGRLRSSLRDPGRRVPDPQRG